MKIKILEPGWENLTGDFGPVAFVNGVSVDDVAPAVATRLANLIRVETLAGVNPSTAQSVLESTTISMDQHMVLNAATGKLVHDADMDKSTGTLPAEVMTESYLVAIADREGIVGLRRIAEPLGLKGVSIVALTTAILASQNPGVTPVASPEGK